MKVKISVGELPLSGYVNIDPVPKIETGKENQYHLCVADPREIAKIIDKAECEHVIANKVLHHVQPSKLMQYVNDITSLLRLHGKIVFTQDDPENITRAYINGEITTLDWNNLVHGSFHNVWDSRTCHVTIAELEDILKQLGLKINKKSVNNFQYTIEAERVD